MRRTVVGLALALAAFALAGSDLPEPPPVPWPNGERLVYVLRWKGLVVGHQAIEAVRTGSGWHYAGRVRGGGLAQLVGFDLVSDSYTRRDLFTRRFQRDLTVPGEGRRVLTAVVGQETAVRFVWVTGQVYTFREPQTDVLDDLSVLYYVRVHPEPKPLWLINYPRLVRAPLEPLGVRRLSSPVGRIEAEGYRFEGEGARIEVWYGRNEARWPLRIYFGQQWGGLSAELVRVERIR
ncbi:DUF3108 domain-containing protein [Oceanithermus profundus]|uniref:DUF3108 domain-containing protein n=1 Tax=Oceanithermus profundus (strain DSM 14977 / NBRC 100410 / VKM B-2274 / 506) TaxID=670487 RepID=E4U532_OCEP5|nr:DUF3108 domain-containing protein [Oceanithermus profundus]ADR37444.1 hypothetical protein Ocepr_1993 [Oceanithermus profundus DSM 14977]